MDHSEKERHVVTVVTAVKTMVEEIRDSLTGRRTDSGGRGRWWRDGGGRGGQGRWYRTKEYHRTTSTKRHSNENRRHIDNHIDRKRSIFSISPPASPQVTGLTAEDQQFVRKRGRDPYFKPTPKGTKYEGLHF